MKKLSPRTHGILDYITVVFLLISPTLFKMQSAGMVFTYVLAIVHLILTFSTDFPGGVLKIIPLKIHGLIEIFVVVVLIGTAILFSNSGDNISFYFYLTFAFVLFIVWAITEYEPDIR